MIRNSIVFKLWAAMTRLVLMVFGRTARLETRGSRLAASVATRSTSYTTAAHSVMMSSLTLATWVYVVGPNGESSGSDM